MKNIQKNQKTKSFQKLKQVASLIVLFMLVALTKTNAITRYVNTGGTWGSNTPCYSTIQAAITASSNGDEIIVNSGTYTGTVTVNKSLKIYGNNSNVNPNDGSWNYNSSRNPESIISTTSGFGFLLSANNIEIKGFQLTGSGGGNSIGNTNITTMYSNWTIENNWIANNTNVQSIFTNGNPSSVLVENFIIKNNRIENNSGALRTSINAWKCGTLSITGNYISGSTYHGINADGFGNGTISNNYIKDTRYGGIQLPTSHSSNQYFVIENNTITGCQTGIYSWTRATRPYIKLLIRNNTILVNAAKLDLNFCDIVLQGTNNNISTPNIVEGNTITISGTVGTSPVGQFTGGPATATYGIVLSGSMGLTRVNNNTVTAIGVNGTPSSTSTNIGPDMSGIYLQNQNTSSSPSATELSGTFQIQSNIVEGFKNSVISFNTSTNALSSLPSGANATITENKLLPSTSGYAILAASGGNLISATCNWYGSTGYADVASKVAGNVTFVPFLVSGTDNDLATNGFQPAPGTCTGVEVTTPTTGSSAAVFTSISQTAITFTFTKGNGAKRIIVAKSGSTSSTNPTSNTSYNANSAYGSGDALDGYVVYNSDGQSATITKLTAGTLYYFSIYEYNYSGANILYSTSTKYTTSATSLQPDADGDGVADADDEYPTDVNKAFNNRYPSASYATLMFEDLWPSKGDYDFNDLVLNYQYNTITNAANQVVEVRYSFVTRAIGGSLHNGFAFQLDNINPNKITSVAGSKANGVSWLQLNGNGTEAGQGDNANIVVFDDAYKLLSVQSGYSFVNVEQGSPDSGKDTTTIVVKFIDNGIAPSGGAINFSNFGHNLFNPYIILNQVRGKEVHLVDKVPSAKANVSFFGVEEDRTNPVTGSYYKTANNLPWAIDISSSIPYPQEKTDISEAYLKFIPWASSNGTTNQTWYLDIQGNRNVSKLILR
jgi:LruC domain-containing protein